MSKKLMLFCALVLVSFTTYAGGLLTNTNQSVGYLRYLARQSTTEVDAIYFNPAGSAFFKQGWNFSLNGQSAFQTRTINSTFEGFKYDMDNPGDPNKKFKGDAAAPFLPSVFIGYKRDKWTFSGSFSVIGGGGKATFDNGLPSFESAVSLVPMLLNKSFGTTQYNVDSYINGKQIIFGLQMGAAYQINDNWGVFGGIRMNYVSNKYTGYIKNIRTNIGGGKDFVNISPVLKGKSDELAMAVEALKEAGKDAEAAAVQAQSDQLAGYADLTSDKQLNATQSGWGVTPIIGVHYRNGKWDVAVKYEMRTKLNIENKNKTKLVVGGKEMFQDGVNTPNDLPSILTVGATYSILPTLRASVGYNHYFDKGAKMAEDKQKHIKQGTNEYLGAIEWDVIDWAQISAGIQRTKYGVTAEYQSDLSFSVSSMSYGFGAGFKLAENVKLNVAYFWTKYDTFDKKSVVAIAGQNIPIDYKFSRTNKVFGVGIDFTF